MHSNAIQTIIRAGLLAGVMDITAAIFISIMRGRTAVRLLQSVATGLLGMDAYEGGLSTALLGGFLHFTIAMIWATLFYGASRKLPILRKQPILSGVVYGTAVYFFMNHVVLPLSAFPHKMTFQLLTGLSVHIVCIGLPIALIVSRYSSVNRDPQKQPIISMDNALSLFIFISFLITATSSFTIAQTGTGRATFAGGCYWCMEEAFESVEGVTSVTSGFEQNVEAVDIRFDPGVISYQELLGVFWRNVDPTDQDGQFCDRGPKYRSAIFYHDEEQHKAAVESKRKMQNVLNQAIFTQLIEADLFSVAPEEDQDFFKKDPKRYTEYKIKCGRARRLQELW
jgi:peptide-methionine (S)-S-oxide reductase